MSRGETEHQAEQIISHEGHPAQRDQRTPNPAAGLRALQRPNLRIMLPAYQGHKQDALELHPLIRLTASKQRGQDVLTLLLNMQTDAVNLKVVPIMSIMQLKISLL